MIEASAGTISRIENGKVNPTKETLLTIAEELKLDSIETAYLLGIDINLIEKYRFYNHISRRI